MQRLWMVCIFVHANRFLFPRIWRLWPVVMTPCPRAGCYQVITPLLWLQTTAMLQHFCTPGTARPSHCRPAPACRARSYSDWVLDISTSFCQPCWTLQKVPRCRDSNGHEFWAVFHVPSFCVTTETLDTMWGVGGWSQRCVTRVTWTEESEESEGSERHEWGCTLRYTATLSPAQRRGEEWADKALSPVIIQILVLTTIAWRTRC